MTTARRRSTRGELRAIYRTIPLGAARHSLRTLASQVAMLLSELGAAIVTRCARGHYHLTPASMEIPVEHYTVANLRGRETTDQVLDALRGWGR